MMIPVSMLTLHLTNPKSPAFKLRKRHLVLDTTALFQSCMLILNPIRAAASKKEKRKRKKEREKTI